MARQPGGVATVRSSAVRTHRGSHKRLRRITLRGNWSAELLIAVLTIVIALLFLIPWLIESGQNGSVIPGLPREAVISLLLDELQVNPAWAMPRWTMGRSGCRRLPFRDKSRGNWSTRRPDSRS